ncbi:response regulator [Tengunoibacter tsumagoiensis]|uniref:DNA-binding response regulator n=1 Tax=Tengunoibacter tsumagoiensis TaxID=2014871 RepID=A0A401ZXN0_9CHLR|nr:response regulator transcription factor [Tengunoibacter tsumagoiensis]GCE11592.1 DNA-binding response regulator [Tengunoibacter tsumagoiensis]
MKKIRLMLVDDHEVVRLGMRAAFELEPDILVVGEASNGAEALAKVPVLDPDVILMDVRMEKLGGIEACREIKNLSPTLQVLLITSYPDDEAMAASILAGASGYLIKNVSRAELLKSVRTVAAGEPLLLPAATKQSLQRITSTVTQGPEDELTRQERNVLAFIARGYTNKQIAEALTITEKTARNHVSNILEKLDLSRRSEAAVFAVQHKLVPPPQ